MQPGEPNHGGFERSKDYPPRRAGVEAAGAGLQQQQAPGKHHHYCGANGDGEVGIDALDTDLAEDCR